MNSFKMFAWLIPGQLILLGVVILLVITLQGCDARDPSTWKSRDAFKAFAAGCPGRVAWARTDGAGVERPVFVAQCLRVQP